jgi:hypothetical protein
MNEQLSDLRMLAFAVVGAGALAFLFDLLIFWSV